MAKRPRTKAEREQERYELERKTWERFRPRLEGIACMADAIEVLKGMPAPDTPFRKHYTNLLWFMDTFSPPGNSSRAEKGLYIEMVKKMEKAGEIEEGKRQQIENELTSAMEKQAW